MEVTVHPDACEAAKNNPVDPYTPLAHDFNSDCAETFADFATWAAGWTPATDFEALKAFADEWLTDNALTEDMFYVHGQNNRPIRVYNSIDARFILEDFYSKMELNFT